MTEIRHATDALSWPRRDPLSHDNDNSQIVIGIVDNTPRAASHTSRQQFRDLLSDAAQNLQLRLRMFSPPRFPGAETSLAIEELCTSKLDGLIVTGTEPLSSRLIHEPCWPLLARLVDWAEDNTISTVWSCLAAHAAVYRLDGIERRAFGTKLFGVFDCTNLYQHAVFDACPPQWKVPHSRYNDLPEDALISRGYKILTRSPVAGTDSFMKQGKSLHLFLQSHLEYDLAALSREYRRDVKRFLAEESDRYPEMPFGYFVPETTTALAAFRQRAVKTPDFDLFADFPQNTITLNPTAPWRRAATRFYRNWLTYLMDQKAARMGAIESRSVLRDSAPLAPDIALAERV